MIQLLEPQRLSTHRGIAPRVRDLPTLRCHRYLETSAIRRAFPRRCAAATNAQTSVAARSNNASQRSECLTMNALDGSVCVDLTELRAFSDGNTQTTIAGTAGYGMIYSCVFSDTYIHLLMLLYTFSREFARFHVASAPLRELATSGAMDGRHRRPAGASRSRQRTVTLFGGPSHELVATELEAVREPRARSFWTNYAASHRRRSRRSRMAPLKRNSQQKADRGRLGIFIESGQ